MSSAAEFPLRPSKSDGDTIVIVVGGVKHETYKSTLMSLPGSRLARLFDAETPPSEVFYDRHPEVFTHVLQYYRSGKLHCPDNLCGALLEEEFAFWGISSSDVEPCCWTAFRGHRDAVDALARIDPSLMEKEESSGQKNKTRPWQWKLWALFDDPCSSKAAKVIAIISLLFILLSIIAFSLETLRKIHPPVQDADLETLAANSSVQNNWEAVPSGRYSGVLDAVELVCLTWFLTEFLIRAFSSPSKRRFLVNVLNIVDLLALFPWFLRRCSGKHCVGALGFLRVMRCLRFLRVFKLMRRVLGVRVLGSALRASATALCVVPLLLFIFVIIFGSVAYYLEVLGDDTEHTVFRDLPVSFWWAAITLTTVGYGDVFPLTALGQIVATACAAVGVLLIVLPVPIIVYNYFMFYSLTKAKFSMLSKKESNVGPRKTP